MKSSEISFKSDLSIDYQEENKEEVDKAEEYNQSPSYNNKISQKEIRSKIWANFKATVSEKELL